MAPKLSYTHRGETDPIQVYSLTGKAVNLVVPGNDNFLIGDAEELVLESGVGFVFSRDADDSFDPAGAANFLLAAHSTSTTLAYHTERHGVDLNLLGASGAEESVGG